MKRSLWFSCLLVLSILFACSPTKDKVEVSQSEDSAQKKAERMNDFIFDCKALKMQALKMDSSILKQTETDRKLANNAIEAFTQFAHHCSSDSLVPIFLIKTAQIAQAINNTPQAKVVLEKCINDYPNFSNRAAVIFLLAQLYDEAIYLNDEEQAKALYQKILDEYPKSDWAISAKGALKYIGKTDQQLIEEFSKRNK